MFNFKIFKNVENFADFHFLTDNCRADSFRWYIDLGLQVMCGLYRLHLHQGCPNSSGLWAAINKIAVVRVASLNTPYTTLSVLWNWYKKVFVCLFIIYILKNKQIYKKLVGSLERFVFIDQCININIHIWRWKTRQLSKWLSNRE